jgi:hypothetical protein
VLSYLAFSSALISVIRALPLGSLRALAMSLVPIVVLMLLASSWPVRFFWVSNSFPRLMISCLVCTSGTSLMRLVLPRAEKAAVLTVLAAPVVVLPA